ncbi:hypothetical protein PR202_ga00227 [Eleusine coracana subsp. coracana]|uniref:acylaminoacyl-peptidase n=1 Tax=Eleusine coracana subsp. coracana TaxID=191504 RepID=A0AAV5BDC5_ELECO|nr:hypothetical protein PR202_ga00227 [Eleusine coracana subsp. coracana]
MATTQVSNAAADKGLPLGMDASMVDEYAAQSKLLQEFVKIPSVGKAWIFNSKNENTSRAMVSFSQSDLLANKMRKFLLNSHISKGEKLLLVRNAEDDSPTKLEVWGPCQLENEIHIPKSVHESLYTDGWFEGISWNQEETFVAYIAEEPPQPKPVFNDYGYKKDGSSEKDCKSWKGQGDWEENWGETYSKKRIPALFVVNTSSGEVRSVKGIPRSLSVGQVIWAPSSSYCLIFVAWSSDNGFQETPRKLGIKYCYNRPCALYAAPDPFREEPEKSSTYCEVSRVSPQDSDYSWNVLALDKNNILAVSSGLITLPQIYYGLEVSQTGRQWEWQEVLTPFPKPSDKISSIVAEHKFGILKIPISNPSDKLANGFGEEALQSLPGNAGSQDVNDVLTALDFVVKKGLIDPSNVAVVGGSHGGFLTTHLIGQAPDTFVAAAARNPVCNLSLMVGTTDIPDWCFVEVYGKEGKQYYSESPSVDDLVQFHQKSPISHISKVKTPTLFLLGAQDLRVPVSNGLQYARALKERGIESKLIVFPEDIHGIDKNDVTSPSFQWSPFPIEMSGVSVIMPSPSGSKLLVVRNGEKGSPTKLEIVDQSHVEKNIHVGQSIHGPLYSDEWFQGISWNQEETLIAYIAEAPPQPKPAFNDSGYEKEGPSEKDFNCWRGKEIGKRTGVKDTPKRADPSLFVLNIASGEVRAAQGIPRSLSVGQVVWAPSSSKGCQKYLVFVGWLEHNGFQNTARKLGLKYCSNRPCALYAIPSPFEALGENTLVSDGKSDSVVIAQNLTASISSAFFPRFSRDGKLLAFLSAKCAVDSGAHNATDSLYKINWPSEWNMNEQVPVVMCPEDGSFPGIYCSSMLYDPWLSDGYTMILTSAWRSTEVIISVDVLSGKITRITPKDSYYSWAALAIDVENILAVSSSPIDPLQIMYGCQVTPEDGACRWTWDEVASPLTTASNSVKSLLSHHSVRILEVPVDNPSADLCDGGKLPFQAIFVPYKDSSHRKQLTCPMQDVQDCLTALDHVIKEELIDASRVAVVGISHGGFLTAHLIGQAPDRFVVAAARNPVCNLALMVGTTDTPDWCYMVACGTEAKQYASESPSPDHLRLFYQKSPVAHISKVKAPLLMLLGGSDLRVPASNGLQYARALRERGGKVKIMMFPEDIHEINLPQSDFESFLNIGVWFKMHME